MHVLGVTSPASANNAAVLVEDGEVIAAVEEERFTDVKHAPNQAPIQSVDYCLSHADISLTDVDHVAVGWGVPPDTPYASDINRIHHRFHRELMPPFLAELEARDDRVRQRVTYVDHQLAHAASAYYCSGFGRANVLCLDGNGERHSGLLGLGDGDIEVFEHVPTGDSLGHFYEQVTEYLGFRRHRDEGKVMGLASYGEPRYDLEIRGPNRGGLALLDRLSLYRAPLPVGVLAPLYWRLSSVTQLPLARTYPLTPPVSNLLAKVSPARLDRWIASRSTSPPMLTGDGKPLLRAHRDLAASAQRSLERRVIDLVERLHELTGEGRFCFAGGVALNCVLNRKILASDYVDELFVQPAAHDAGAALGAALAVAAEHGHRPVTPMRDVYLGPEYGGERIAGAIEDRGLEYERSGDVCAHAADALADDRIVGWFQGRMEFGPRALGARSILANPADSTTKDRVNEQVKAREPWRPFAPALRLERADGLFRDARPSPFMVLSFELAHGQAERIPAATHVDGTARPQTVERDVNPDYYNLIETFEGHTGTPAVLNTSFNVAGDPINRTPEQAVDTFLRSGMDELCIGDFAVRK